MAIFVGGVVDQVGVAAVGVDSGGEFFDGQAGPVGVAGGQIAPSGEFFAGGDGVAARGVAPDGVEGGEIFDLDGQAAAAAARGVVNRRVFAAGVGRLLLVGAGEERVAAVTGGGGGRGSSELVARRRGLVCRRLTRRRCDRGVAVDDPERPAERRPGNASLVAGDGGVEEGGASRGWW